MAVDASTTLGDLVTADPRRSRVMERFGIDYCCNGSRSLAEASADAGIELSTPAAALEIPDPPPVAPSQHLENAALALAESANLLTIADRRCSNGEVAPTKDPSWTMFVSELREASMQAYKAAQTKQQEKIAAISERLSTSCSSCHRKFRDRRAPYRRCT